MESVDDPYADWRTPTRAETSSVASLMEALRYFLRSRGISVDQLKQLSFAVRAAAVRVLTLFFLQFDALTAVCLEGIT